MFGSRLLMSSIVSVSSLYIVESVVLKKLLCIVPCSGLNFLVTLGKQGRDDSIKQFSTQLHPTYL